MPSIHVPSPTGLPLALLTALLLPTLAATAAPELELGGSIRAYSFLQVEEEDLVDRQDDSQLAILRLTGKAYLSESWSAEAHAVGEWQRPTATPESTIATSRSRSFFELEHESSPKDWQARYLLDRLNLRYDSAELRLTIGRQAISWGVARFWPTLDLFAPFAPQRLDRTYKPGVDAVRAVIPVGQLSEIDLIVGSLGPSLSDDGTAALLWRRQIDTADLGLILGTFHRDIVAGVFIESEINGTGVYAETAYTHARDLPDERFWRATIGASRQLNAATTATAEFTWSEFGSPNTADYPAILRSDRSQRGEIQSLGRLAAAVNLSVQVHPLVTLGATALVNLNDGSSLWLPTLTWSTGDNSTLEFGAVITAGPRTTTPFAIGSQYNASPSTMYLGWSLYF